MIRSFIMTAPIIISEIEQEDGSKSTGKAKNTDRKIIQMGLFMDGDGIPLAFLSSGKCKRTNNHEAVRKESS